MAVYNGGNGEDFYTGGAAADTIGGAGDDDILNGGGGDDSIDGGLGGDILGGGDGDDTIAGGAGGDALNGGNGADRLIGGEGSDQLTGGAGTDTAQFAGLSTDYSYNALEVRDLKPTINGNDGTDGLSGIERLQFLDKTIFLKPNIAPTAATDANAAANSVSEGAANGSLVGITAASTDADADVITYSLVNNAGGRFAINAATGVVTVANGALLNYETATSHQITVRSSDPWTSTDQTFTIQVANVAPTSPTDANGGANTVAEGAAANTLIGLTAQAADVNGGTITYSLVGDSSDGGFKIDAATGVVSVADGSKLNYESATSHQLTVRAKDPSGASSADLVVTVAVGNVAPSSPTDGNAAANTIAEGAANGAVVGITAQAADVNGGTITYSLADNAGGRFAINAATGVVTVADGSLLNFEGASSHQVTVHAADPAGAASPDQTFTIAVTNVAPSSPTDANAAANAITEGAANGTAVGLIAQAADPSGGTITYSLADNAGGRFAINATTGVVTVADGSLLNFEDATSHQITVHAADPSGAASPDQSFTIAVTNVAPSGPTDANAAADTVAEGAAADTLAGVTAQAADLNGGTITYSLVGDTSNGGFKINSATGVVSVADGSKLDFESNPNPQITIRAADASNAHGTDLVVTVALANVAPSTPTDADSTANTVAEGAASGTTVGVTALSLDPSGGTITYSMAIDTSNGGFAVDAATGVVSVADGTKLNFEGVNNYAVTVHATDAAGLAAPNQTFNIALTNVAPSAPADTNAATNSVAEGAAADTLVGITASSTDVNGGTITYSLVGDATNGGFKIDAASGVVTVADGSKLDFESNPNPQLTIRAQDPSNAHGTDLVVTVALTNVAPSSPADVDGAANAVAEWASHGALLGLTALAVDPSGGVVTYSLTNDAGGRFAIDPLTGVVSVADQTKLDYDTATSHQITVHAQDASGAASADQSFTIQVTNAPPSTPTDTNNATNTVAEGAAADTLVGITAQSADPNGGVLTYSLVNDTSNGGFKIDSATGVVTVADATKLDFETANGHTLTIRATDAASEGSLTDLVVNVAVTNVAPSASTDSNAAANSVAEGAANGTAVGVTALAMDPSGGAVTYSLANNAGGRFGINASTGVVTVANGALLNFESNASHQITVHAQDSSGLASADQNFTIQVTNVAPSSPTDNDAGTNSVFEGASNGVNVGITALAADVNGGTVTYSLANDAGGRFAINATTGVVTVANGALLNYEDAISHQITIHAQDDSGAASADQGFTIGVSNVAPGPSVDSNVAANTVAEGAANGTAVGLTALATDPSGGAITYSLANDAGGRFAINASSGVVTVANSALLNFEAATSHDITVHAADASGAAAADQIFTIAVTNVAPSSPMDADAAINRVAEGAANGAAVGITAQAADVNGGAITYSLLDNAGGRFAINGSTGVVTVANGSLLDYEAATSHQINVRAVDASGAHSSDQLFTIGVQNRLNVGVYGSTDADSNESYVASVLRGLPMFESATVLNGAESVATLSQYDSILAWQNARGDVQTFGSRLADYVDGGGHLVVATFIGQSDPYWFGPSSQSWGRLATDGYLPFDDYLGNYNNASLASFDPSNWLFSEAYAVDNNPLIAAYYHDMMDPSADATIIGYWSDGAPFAMVDSTGVVALTMWPSASFSSDSLFVFVNALVHDTGWIA